MSGCERRGMRPRHCSDHYLMMHCTYLPVALIRKIRPQRHYQPHASVLRRSKLKLTGVWCGGKIAPWAKLGDRLAPIAGVN